MNSRPDDLDSTFIDLAVKHGHLAEDLAGRVLAFARLKRRSVARVAADLGVMPEPAVERTSRLAQDRLARQEDRRLAKGAIRAGVLTKRQAVAALQKQATLYREGRGLVRFVVLLRAHGKLTIDEEQKIHELAREPRPEPKRAPRVRPAAPSGSGSTYGRVIAALA